jgi:hypothetical protein
MHSSDQHVEAESEDPKVNPKLFDPWEARFRRDLAPAKINVQKHPEAKQDFKAA